MKKIIYASLMALLTFSIFNFFYCNLGGEAFNYPLSFKFVVPHIISISTLPVPVGFLLISAFCLGMVFLPLLQLIPVIFRTAQIRARDRKIRELERELETARSGSVESITPDRESDASS